MFNILRNISNTDLNSLATIFDIKLSNKKCQKWAAGFLAHNGTYEEQKMIFQTTRSLTSAEDRDPQAERRLTPNKGEIGFGPVESHKSGRKNG